MPSASESLRLKAQEILGVKVASVKQTAAQNILMAMCEDGAQVQIDRNTWQAVIPVIVPVQNKPQAKQAKPRKK